MVSSEEKTYSDDVKKKMQEKRRQVAKELLETEKTYVKNLGLLISVFCCPLEENANGPEDKRVITKDDVRAIFGSLKMILPINKMLLTGLETQLEVPPDEPIVIGKAFEHMAFCLRSYTSYCTDYDASRKILAQLNTNPSFEIFFKKLHKTELIGKSTMKDFLIMPVQRVPRYRMLLSELLKNTWESHIDYIPIKDALDKVSVTAQAIEDAQEKYDNRNKIISIQNELKQSRKEERLTLLQPNRSFIKEGILDLKNQSISEIRKRKIILFSDLIVIAKIVIDRSKKKKNSLKLVEVLYVGEIKEVIKSTLESKPTVSIFFEDTNYFLQPENEKERDIWFDKLVLCKEKINSKKRLRTTSIGPQPRSSPKKSPSKKKKRRAKTVNPSDEKITINPLIGMNSASKLTRNTSVQFRKLDLGDMKKSQSLQSLSKEKITRGKRAATAVISPRFINRVPKETCNSEKNFTTSQKREKLKKSPSDNSLGKITHTPTLQNAVPQCL